MLRGRRYFFLVFGAFLLWLAASSVALSVTVFSKDNPSYTQVGRSINIGASDEVGDLTCFGCSVHVHGLVAGDVTTFGGNIAVEDQAQISGDVTAFGGDLRLTKGVKVDGDVTVFGGQVRRDPEATVAGDVTSMNGRGWVALIFLVPLVVIGVLVALVIWLVQRARRPSVPAPAA